MTPEIFLTVALAVPTISGHLPIADEMAVRQALDSARVKIVAAQQLAAKIRWMRRKPIRVRPIVALQPILNLYAAQPEFFSDTDMKILRLKNSGMAPKDIAIQLSMSANSVNVRIRHMIAKVGGLDFVEEMQKPPLERKTTALLGLNYSAREVLAENGLDTAAKLVTNSADDLAGLRSKNGYRIRHADNQAIETALAAWGLSLKPFTPTLENVLGRLDDFRSSRGGINPSLVTQREYRKGQRSLVIWPVSFSLALAEWALGLDVHVAVLFRQNEAESQSFLQREFQRVMAEWPASVGTLSWIATAALLQNNLEPFHHVTLLDAPPLNGQRKSMIAQITQWVAPGGTLLVSGPEDFPEQISDHWRARGYAHSFQRPDAKDLNGRPITKYPLWQLKRAA